VIVWFGLVTVAQAFTEVSRAQSVAVVLGLIPMMAQWASGIADTVARAAGSSLAEILPRMGTELALGGLIALGQGGLLTSMLWAAALALAIDRRFSAAAGWMFAAAVLAAFGVIHAYALGPAGIEGRIGWWVAPEFALSYAAGAAFLLLCGWYVRRERVWVSDRI
jgi:adenine/guanine/hypoxanthine permease